MKEMPPFTRAYSMWKRFLGLWIESTKHVPPSLQRVLASSVGGLASFRALQWACTSLGLEAVACGRALHSVTGAANGRRRPTPSTLGQERHFFILKLKSFAVGMCPAVRTARRIKKAYFAAIFAYPEIGFLTLYHNGTVRLPLARLEQTAVPIFLKNVHFFSRENWVLGYRI